MSDMAELPKQDQKPRSKSLFRRPWFWWLCAVVVLGAAATVGAMRYYPKWNEKRLARRAEALISAKDYRSAVLTARRILQQNPNNLDAITVMFKAADVGNLRSSVYWLHRLVELEPGKLEHKLDLADRSLRLGNLGTAQEMLNKGASNGTNSARFHELAGRLALAKQHLEEAEAELDKAVQLEPDNQTYAFEWATQALTSTNPEKHAKATHILEGQLKQPEFFLQATRSLIDDSLKRKQWTRALDFARALWARPSATLEECLVYLQLLHDLQQPEFAGHLSVLQDAVVANPNDTAKLMIWLATNHCALLGVEWSKRLPRELANTMPVPIAVAKAYLALGDWRGLQAIVVDPTNSVDPTSPAASNASSNSAGNARLWADFEFMRQALAAKTLREQGELNASRLQWNAALKNVGKRTDALALLAHAAVDWGWDAESQELLWNVVNTSNDSRWALDLLYSRYAASHSSRNMIRVLTRIHQISPNDYLVLNNLATLCLLSEDTTQQGVAYAEKLYQANPTNPAAITTYAFALHLQGRSSEGIQLMQSLGDEVLGVPAYAAYYGILQAEAGNPQKANHFLNLGLSAELLPEERGYVERALAKLGPSPTLVK